MPKRKYGRKRGKQPSPYRSWLEHDFHKRYNQLDYEPKSYPYVIKHMYTPDFITPCGRYMIETKGRFHNSAEARKYVELRKCLFEDEPELIFVFENPLTPFPHARKRKDGTKMTHKEWADKNNFKWCTVDTFKKKEWMDE
jgi:hypothetical protein